MPLTFQLENNKQGVLVIADGVITGEEFLTEMEEFFSDEQTIRSYRYGLNDFTQLDKFNISAGQIFSMAKLHIKASKINPDLIVGFAIKKPLIYGLVRIWVAYAGITGWDVNIKKSMPEIREWIDKRLYASVQ